MALCSKFCQSHSFSGIFFAILSHIYMKVGSKLIFEELQIDFDFCQDQLFHKLSPFVQNWCSGLFFAMLTDFRMTFLCFAFTKIEK